MEKNPDAFRTISEAAEDLDLPQHVLRFWETRFAQIKPLKRGGGRRYYRPDDIELLRAIRQLLYGQGYTIKGVQRILKDQGARALINASRDARQMGVPADRPDVGEAPADSAAAALVAAAPDPEGADARSEAQIAGAPNGLETEAAPMRPPLSVSDLQRLKEVMAELADCERVLDAARRI